MGEAIVFALGYTGATAATAAGWINFAIVVLGSVYSAKEQRRRARNARREAARAGEFTTRGATPPLVTVYGQPRVAPHMLDIFSAGAHLEYLHLVLKLADHECEGITALWFNGEKITLDGNGFVTNDRFVRSESVGRSYQLYSGSSGVLTLPFASASQPVIIDYTTNPESPAVVTGVHTVGTTTITGVDPDKTYQVDYTSVTITPLIRIRTHLGQPGQVADADLISESGGRWTSAMRGDGICYVWIRSEFDPLLNPYDPEDWMVEVRGKRLLDPRTNVTQWSNNCELVVFDWLRDSLVGPGIAGSTIAEIAAGANVCDEGVRTQQIQAPNAAGYFEPFVTGVGSWVAGSGTGTTIVNNGDGTVRVACTGNDHVIICAPPGFAVSGAAHRYVRARIKRVAGGLWDGTVYYSTAGHTFTSGFFKQLPSPSFLSEWRLVEWDMHALNIGGTDWASSTITGIRIDLGVQSGDVFDIDWIAIGGSVEQPRYTYDGVVTDAQPLREIIDDMMEACAGTTVYAQGRWFVRPGAHRIPALTIDEASLSGNAEPPVKIVPVPSGRARYNAVRAFYAGPDSDYVRVAAPTVRNAQYVAEDGGVEAVLDLELAHVCDSSRAQRLAKIELERIRQGLTCEVTTNLLAYDLLPTDTCALDLGLPGFDNKAFFVDSRSWAGAGELQYQLVETTPEIWEWNDGMPTVGDPAPNTSLRSPATPPALIQGLTLASGPEHRRRMGDDSWQGRVLVSWTPIADTYVTQGGWVEVEWYASGNVNATPQPLPRVPGDQSSTYIDPAPQVQTIIARARAVNALGKAGEWSYRGHQVEDQTTVDTGETYFLEVLDYGQAPPIPVYVRARTNTGAPIQGPYDCTVLSNSVLNAPSPIVFFTGNNTDHPIEITLEALIAVTGFPNTINGSWYFDARLLAAKTSNPALVETSSDPRAEPSRASLVSYIGNKGKPTPPNVNMTEVGSTNAVVARTPVTKPTILQPGEPFTALLRLHLWINGTFANTGDYELSFFGSYLRAHTRRI